MCNVTIREKWLIFQFLNYLEMFLKQINKEKYTLLQDLPARSSVVPPHGIVPNGKPLKIPNVLYIYTKFFQ